MKSLFTTQLMTSKWLKAFLISHITGWLIFTLQSFWIVYEVRKTNNDR